MKLKNWSEFVEKYPALGLIGNTPLMKINIFPDFPKDVSLYAKVEWFNPGGSIKDRPVSRMIFEAICEGKLRPGITILDSSSGNAGIAYAMIGKLLGYPVKLVMPENVSQERKKRIQAHGAEIVFTNVQDGYDEALRTCRKIYEEDPGKYFFPDQYSNKWNWTAHYEGTAKEILEQTKEKITHFVAGVGTGGTITGVGRRLKELNRNIQVISVLPEEFPGIEGLKPLNNPTDIRPAILDESVIDTWVAVTSEDAYSYCQRMAGAGIFMGQSSGAYLKVAYEVARELKKGVVVTIFPDLGERYFSTGLWGR